MDNLGPMDNLSYYCTMKPLREHKLSNTGHYGIINEQTWGTVGDRKKE